MEHDSGRRIDPYSTHTPVLISIPKVFEIRRVLEFGSGLFSTKVFLSTIYPNVEVVISYECDVAWAEIMNQQVKDPVRYFLFCESEKETIKNHQNTPSIFQWDLIFIDGKTGHGRVEFLKASVDKSKIIVIHDSENDYWDSIRTINDYIPVAYNNLFPNTTTYFHVSIDQDKIEKFREVLACASPL